ncbi:AAA family ATPase [Sphingobium sp. CECT 9361]|uniref:AAA family ATPase n=1 Tax=Sphingobium sp. CECT 9361 TaxID=2845384 RepID=UPI001E355247|nr:AAA family ATPase [Sphingobium sp. CECT 9361]CAH0354368.1 Chromosome partition protein Smc [Sphingobium sp. CECT 9361]
MSLYLRRIAIDGFRKFREPMAIEGLTDGLNIVIEPNETGKSTVLEALRAAFFVRHGTKNQLAQSFAPYGEAVGPEIQVSFDADGAPWTVTKRFLRSASIEVTGPQGKAQGEEAEARLHALLGSVRDTSQKGDAGSYGALGLLWVAQAEALAVTGPGQIVRDTVRSTLEAEVGSIMGGPAYARVRARIDEQYGRYWSPTGQKRGRQNEARERVEQADAAAREAAERLAGLERTFSELENARSRLKVVHREIADDTDVQTRKDLTASLETARAAAQILATRRAEHEAISAKTRNLEDLVDRHRKATEERTSAELALEAARSRRTEVREGLATAQHRLADARSALEAARTARQEARRALTAGEELLRATRRRGAVSAACARHAELVDLERLQEEATALTATLIPAKAMDAIEANERLVAAARAARAAGATRIALVGDAEGISIDGEPMAIGERTLSGETRLRLGNAELIITPPAGAASAEVALSSALERQTSAFADLGLTSLAEARARNDTARDAVGELRTIAARIAAVTPADDIIGLAAGPDALKLFIVEMIDEDEAVAADIPDVALLTAKLEAADTALARAEGSQESAVEALRRVEQEDAPLASAEAGAASTLANANSQIEAIEGRPEFSTLTADVARAREQTAEAAVKLEEATRDATAHDPAAIMRRIETIDARVQAAGEARAKLEMDVARLEGTIESEGGKGLADREAGAREEAEAARAALQRITEEADTLELLRDTLDEARDETSAKFVGPVTKRAKRHIERLLPCCDLSFSEDLTLEAVVRGGISEGCGDLSRGTQEQLAVLTRIAFADMLLEQGRPVSLILDDPLVYADDARLDLMVEILSEAAERMQVVILTCRDRAFRHVLGNRVSMVSSR